MCAAVWSVRGYLSACVQQTKGKQNLQGTRASLGEQLDVSQHTYRSGMTLNVFL